MPSDAGKTPDPSPGEVDPGAAVEAPPASPGDIENPPDLEGAKAGASPTPKPDEVAPKTPLEVVQSAVKQEPAKPDPGVAADGKPVVDPNKQADEDKGKPPPFHEHPRWKEMVAKNRELERQVQEYAPLKENAERYSNLNGFLVENNISAEDFSEGLNIMYLMQNDPAKALETLQPYIEILSKQAGKVLDADLSEKVERGLIDEETAYRAQADRARNSTLSKQLEARELRERTLSDERKSTEETEARKAKAQALFSAVADWEKQWSTTDPDYAKLSPLVRDRVVRLMRDKPPETPEAAVVIAKQATQEIKEEMRKLAPAKQPITPSPGGVNQHGRPAPAPKSSLDVVRQAVAAH
jgi:hypothetical protein